ncbi:MAG: c-type cytochrome [Deltaproteobacteria bacterium]|nr:MAG: c-type cytochrome [Deltaproteobacteria bacterium]
MGLCGMTHVPLGQTMIFLSPRTANRRLGLQGAAGKILADAKNAGIAAHPGRRSARSDTGHRSATRETRPDPQVPTTGDIHMRKLSVFSVLVAGPVVALTFLAAPGFSAELPTGASMADGKALFLENKCDKCHSVTSKGVEAAKPDKAVDLSTVSGDADFLAKFLKKEATKAVDGKDVKHKKKWGGSDEDLSAIIGWLKG